MRTEQLITAESDRKLQTELTQTIQTLKRETRQKFLLVFAVSVSITVLAAALLTGIARGDFEFPVSAAIVGFVMLLINNCTFQKTEDKRKTAFRQHTELLPSDLDPYQLGDLERDDLAYNAGRKTIRRNRNAILILSFILMIVFPFSLFIGIPAALIYSITAKNKLGERQITPYAQLDAHAESWNGAMQWCYFVLWLIAAVFALLCAGLSYTAGSRVRTAESNAKTVYQAAIAYQNELSEQGLDKKLKTVIVSPHDPRTEGTLAYGIHPYYSDGDRYWYAVICDQDGNITAAYWCQTELTPDKLIPPVHEDQLATAKSLFHRKELIGYYSIQNEGDL